MNVVCFRYFGKIGHFLRAEANANGITYPVPPRTVLLGLVGAVLGLTKDEPQVRLAGAKLAVGGDLPKRFWHKTNIRKDPPAPLSYRVKSTDKGTSSEQRNFRFPQEWLWKPDFRVWASLSGDYHADFAGRLKERRWHFTPCLGLAWMLAELEFLGEYEALSLPVGTHRVCTAVPKDAVELTEESRQEMSVNQLTLQLLRMPADATADRVFTHRAYWLEVGGRSFPVTTGEAWQCGSEGVVFL